MKYIIILFLLLICNNISAQKVLEIKNVVGFYAKEKAFIVDHQKGTCVNINSKLKFDTVVIENKKFIPVNKIKSFSVEEFESLLENRSFILGKQDDKLIVFSKLSKHIVSYNPQSDFDGKNISVKKEYSDIHSKFYAYMYVKLEKNKYIMAIVTQDRGNMPNILGYIVPLYDGLLFFDTKTLYSSFYNGNESYSQLYLKGFEYRSFYDILTLENGDNLIDDLFQEPIMKDLSEVRFNENQIFARIKGENQYNAYDKLLRDFNIEGIRTVSKDIPTATEVLIGNEVKWIRTNGDVLDSVKIPLPKPSETAKYYKDRLYKRGYFESRPYWVLRKDSRLINNEYVSRTYFMRGSDNIDSICFWNNGQQFRYNSIDYFTDRVYVKYKNGKYDICKYSISEDSCRLVDCLVEKADSIVGSRFYTNGLVGYFPGMRTAEYKSVEGTIGNLIRVELPSGEQGWYNPASRIKLFLDIPIDKK